VTAEKHPNLHLLNGCITPHSTATSLKNYNPGQVLLPFFTQQRESEYPPFMQLPCIRLYGDHMITAPSAAPYGAPFKDIATTLELNLSFLHTNLVPPCMPKPEK